MVAPSIKTPVETPRVRFTPNAQQNLAVRGITAAQIADILQGMKVGDVKTDFKTGNLVYRKGNLRIVAKNTGAGEITVLTAMRVDDLK